MELKDIKGFGEKRLALLKEKGIETPLDLLKLEPTKYMDYTSIVGLDKENSMTQTIKVQVETVAKLAYFKGKSAVSARVCCAISGKKTTAVWYNQPFMKNNLKLEQFYYLTGRISKIGQFVVSETREVARVSDTIVPIYGATNGLGGAVIISAVKQILESGENYSVIPSVLEKDYKMGSLMEAFGNVHFPASVESLGCAKARIGFEDLVLLAGMEQKLLSMSQCKTRKYDVECIKDFKAGLPFLLTADQECVLDEIIKDLDDSLVMNRLVLGDVGSGKTLVAFGAAFVAGKSGYQTVMLCPTEILAEQHYESANKFLKNSGLRVRLLHSRLPRSERDFIKDELKKGDVDFLISTHACLGDSVGFKNLALVITDEQHRFGVKARAGIEKKGDSPDVLVMSATPIPRSLSLVLFGGLKVSEIKTRPGGESKISTKVVPFNKEKDMWTFILGEIRSGAGKCFVIAPRIEDGDGETISVGEIEKRLKMFGFGENEFVCVHGKTEKPEAKARFDAFKSGRAKVLISTTIVEVGVDVPDANLMVIYNAERFGLATLHQLRGRVGRDGRAGYCFAMSDTESEISKQRLNTFKTCNNGTKLAEVDLKLRGAGTVYGTKQHGASEIFINIDFSIDEYKKAQDIVKRFSESELLKLESLAERRFGKIYEDIVLN